jgi:extradiol dioxygenase family protein
MIAPRFHLSIPSADLAVTERWYVDGLGCVAGRRSEHAQIEASLDRPQSGIYPRHFGLVFEQLSAWEALRDRARCAALRFGVEPKCRYQGQELEHHTFFLIDPDHNWLEFKHYRQSAAVLGCRHWTLVGDGEIRGSGIQGL